MLNATKKEREHTRWENGQQIMTRVHCLDRWSILHSHLLHVFRRFFYSSTRREKAQLKRPFKLSYPFAY